MRTPLEYSQEKIGRQWTAQDHAWLAEQIKKLEQLAADMAILVGLQKMQAKEKKRR